MYSTESKDWIIERAGQRGDKRGGILLVLAAGGWKV
jgi:hypothetical protein